MRESITTPHVFPLQPDPMVLLNLNTVLPKSSIFSMMQMIYETTLQPPTNGLYITVSRHVSIVIEIVVSIIPKNPVIKYVLHR